MNGTFFPSWFLFPMTTVAVTNRKYNEIQHCIRKYASFLFYQSLCSVPCLCINNPGWLNTDEEFPSCVKRSLYLIFCMVHIDQSFLKATVVVQRAASTHTESILCESLLFFTSITTGNTWNHKELTIVSHLLSGISWCMGWVSVS